MEITLRVILKQPTPDVEFALQKGRGSKYETVQKQRSVANGDLSFEFPVTIKTAKDDTPDFAGEYVQGVRGDRYVYIGIGTFAGQTNTQWSRRLKIPLSCLTWDLIKSGRTLVGEIPGTDKSGGPSCAYVWLKKFDPPWQWQPVKRSSNR